MKPWTSFSFFRCAIFISFAVSSIATVPSHHVQEIDPRLPNYASEGKVLNALHEQNNDQYIPFELHVEPDGFIRAFSMAQHPKRVGSSVLTPFSTASTVILLPRDRIEPIRENNSVSPSPSMTPSLCLLESLFDNAHIVRTSLAFAMISLVLISVGIRILRQRRRDGYQGVNNQYDGSKTTILV